MSFPRLGALACAAVALAGACGGSKHAAAKPARGATTTTSPAAAVAPLTGLPDPGGVASKRCAVTVKIDNTEAGHPKYGVDQADVVYEDETCLAFRDVNPQAPVHVLVIPRQEIPSLAVASDEDSLLLGHLISVARRLATQMGLTGYRVVINCGSDGGQTVDHLHLRVRGRQRLA